MYYLRMQGRVTGPFTMDKMKALRSRGILQPFHELSSDRANWHAASGVADLFPPVATEPVATVASPAPAAQPQAVQGPAWFYLDSRKERCGPVGEEVLPFMIERGEFNKKTLVWTSGMAEWSPASEIFPRLFNQYASSENTENSAGSIGKLAWLMQGRALLLIFWPIMTFLSMYISNAILVRNHDRPPNLIILSQLLFFILQAIVSVLIAVILLKISTGAGKGFAVAGYIELAGTCLLFVFYLVFSLILMFFSNREERSYLLVPLMASYVLCQLVSIGAALSLCGSLVLLARSRNHWLWIHFSGLGIIAAIMFLNVAAFGCIGIAVASDPNAAMLIDRNADIPVMAYFLTYLLFFGKFLEFNHSLLTLPIASSMRNTM